MRTEFDDQYNAAHDLLSRNLTPERRDRVAYIDSRGRWTYGWLADRAARFAGVLRALGVQPEQRVALCLSDTVDFPVCFLGALQLGAVPIPLNTRLASKDYQTILADSRAVVLVVSDAVVSAFDDALNDEAIAVHVLGEAALAAVLEEAVPETRFAATRRGDMAFWLYTSGTTGRPKGVVHAHSHLIDTAELYGAPYLQLTEQDVVFSAAKLFFAYGLGNALTFPMAAGATTVLLEGPPTPAAIGELFREHDPTVFYGVPTLFAMLLARADHLHTDGRLRLCTSAGEALPAELHRRWHEATGVDILDGLGSTEALHIFISNRPGAVVPGSTGRPVPGYDVRLVDDDGAPVPDGELGHLEVSGPTTAMFYWNRRERTKDTFRGRWMRTGDRYHRTEAGDYVYGGRSDDLMKVGGIWVSPFEVESALISHSAVLEAAVVAQEDDDGLIKPRAHVVLQQGHDPSDALESELIAFVRAHLAPYKRPRWVVFETDLPKTATGKIQRYKLRA